MGNKLFLELVSPEKMLVSSEVENVYAVGKGGAFGIHEGHSAFCTELVPCVLTYDDGKKTTKVVLLKGFLTVADNKVNVLAEKAVFSEDIDFNVFRENYNKLSRDLSGEIKDEDVRKEKELDFRFYELALELQ